MFINRRHLFSSSLLRRSVMLVSVQNRNNLTESPRTLNHSKLASPVGILAQAFCLRYCDVETYGFGNGV